jgi:hypothetical protein
MLWITGYLEEEEAQLYSSKYIASPDPNYPPGATVKT